MLVLKTRSLLFDDWWAGFYVSMLVCVLVDAEILVQSFWRARDTSGFSPSIALQFFDDVHIHIMFLYLKD